ncbi:MAG TPA: hypothetical protein VFR46_06595 [Actinomycetes bacterium]|jgi:hypothetical protein|nr:hypothetical protein [Actinomycetes bacterium]HJY24695.1 hypothetical protein [Actinomycetes bacterium]
MTRSQDEAVFGTDRPEDQGFPDTADDSTPERRDVPDPEEMPLPGERPVGVTEFGTTAEEEIEGETLDMRLAREVPDEEPIDPTVPRDEDQPDETVEDVEGALPVWADDEPRTVGQIVEEDEGVREDVEKDTVALEDPLGPGGLGPEDQALYRTDSP